MENGADGNAVLLSVSATLFLMRLATFVRLKIDKLSASSSHCVNEVLVDKISGVNSILICPVATQVVPSRVASTL